MSEQVQIHVYYKVSFFKYEGDMLKLIAGIYIEKQILEEEETLKSLATFYFQFNNNEMINIRIKRKEKRFIKTEYNHFERPMEVIH